MRAAMLVCGSLGNRALSLAMAHPGIDVVAVGIADVSQLRESQESRRLAARAPFRPLGRIIGERDLAWLSEHNPEMIIMAWWPYILPPRVLDLPPRGCLNFHPSLLPHCRGRDPNFWSIVEGRPFGATLHFADASVDGGDIAYQVPLRVSWEDDGQTLLDRSKQALLRLFEEHIDEIAAGTVPRHHQPPGGSPHRRSQLEGACEVRLDEPTTARRLLNVLRARMFEPPGGAAWFMDGGVVYDVRVSIQRRPSTSS